MTKTFANYADLANDIAFAICDRVAGVQYGRSSRSISTYATVETKMGEFKARISDHAATASCPGSIVAELMIADLGVTELYDDGEFDGVEVSDFWRAAEFIEAAVAKLNAIVAEAEKE